MQQKPITPSGAGATTPMVKPPPEDLPLHKSPAPPGKRSPPATTIPVQQNQTTLFGAGDRTVQVNSARAPEDPPRPKSPAQPGKPSPPATTIPVQQNQTTLFGAGATTATDNSAPATPTTAPPPPKSPAPPGK